MGEVEIDHVKRVFRLYADIITYGHAADEALTELMRTEIESMWNEAEARLLFQGKFFEVHFHINATLNKSITEFEVISNLNPRNNYFRIETFSCRHISYVDGLGCNSGYFKLDNLYAGSTTAAHEFGHTIGLDHPRNLDFRGKGIPRIMYPRGTWVDPPFQYDPSKSAGEPGGTMHPKYRKVFEEDILALQLHKLPFENNRAIIGAFTNVYHEEEVN
ncbi:MAG: peptidase M10 [Bacteroidetes bacterium]|nr:peptidase M10 [Bacteroidota bacterium]